MNGDFFVGRRACELGLIDHIGTAQHVLPERFGKDVTLNLVNPRKMVWPWSFGQDSQSGLVSSILDNIQDRMEEAMLRSRYGL
jgi:ClpP class serine protease